MGVLERWPERVLSGGRGCPPIQPALDLRLTSCSSHNWEDALVSADSSRIHVYSTVRCSLSRVPSVVSGRSVISAGRASQACTVDPQD